MRGQKKALSFFLMALFIAGSLPITSQVSADDGIDNWSEHDAWLHIELISWSANETVEWDSNGGLPDPIFKICVDADGDNLDCFNTPTWENQMTLNNSWNYSIDIPDHSDMLNITIECEDNDALNDDECDMNSELDEWRLYAEYNWSANPNLTVSGNGDGDGNETWKNAASTWKFTIGGFGDEDGDGISDTDDVCAGFDDMDDFDDDGIPSGCDDDDDGDGTPDVDDQCANTPLGAIVDAGCPMDADEDGVYDGLDDCPDSNGDAGVDGNGCDLDSDSDGIPDWDDMCPNTPEDEEIDSDWWHSGCSSSQIDRDEDGVTDDIDLCPSTYSWLTVDSDGCADEQLDDDNDGVSNADDDCPYTPEDFNALNSRGCSFEDLQDSDGDEIPDFEDECSNTPLGAVVDYLGCPSDSDADGVFNGIDECSNTPQGSTVNSLGCSDVDSDGIYDAQDECENTPSGATADSKGCPMDSDSDGVYDGIDECPSSDNPTPSDMDKSSEVDSTGCFVEAAESRIDSELAVEVLGVMIIIALVILGVYKVRNPKQQQAFYAQTQSVRSPVQQQSVSIPDASSRERQLEHQSRQAQIEAQRLRQLLTNQAQLTQQLQSETAQKQMSDAALAEKQHELAVAQQEKEELEAKLAEAEKNTSIVQNITYNIQDSAISGDITNKITRNDLE